MLQEQDQPQDAEPEDGDVQDDEPEDVNVEDGPDVFEDVDVPDVVEGH